jgi:hypothetical protein
MEYPWQRTPARHKSRADENLQSERKLLQAVVFRRKFGTYRKRSNQYGAGSRTFS